MHDDIWFVGSLTHFSLLLRTGRKDQLIEMKISTSYASVIREVAHIRGVTAAYVCITQGSRRGEVRSWSH